MDARFLYIVVVLFTTFDTQVLETTIASTRATTTTAMSATVTSAPSPTPTKAPSPSKTGIEVILLVEEKCSDVIKANLTTGIKSICSQKDYDYKNSTMQLIQTDDKKKCSVIITVWFGRELKLKDSVKMMKDAAKSGFINTTKIELVLIQGLSLTEWKLDSASYLNKCCKSTIGSYKMTRVCTTNSGRPCCGIKVEYEEDCGKASGPPTCSKACSLANMSLVTMLMGFIASKMLLKE